MKELALLMFCVGCGYVLTQFAGYFCRTKTRPLYFRIPSAASFNILWGFVFYTGFGILSTASLSLKFILGGFLLALLGCLVRQHLFGRYFTKQTPRFVGRLLTRSLHRQHETDMKFNEPYSRADALRLLGLPAALTDTDSRISKQISLLEKLNFPSEDKAMLTDLLLQLRQALSLK